MEKIDKAEKKKKELSDLCSLPEYYQDTNKLNDVAEKMKALDDEISLLYEQLEQAM